MGPAVAGLVGDTIGWRFVFLGLLPLILVAALIAFPALVRVGPPDAAADAEAAAAASLYHPTCSAGVGSVASCLALADRLGYNPLPA